VCAVLKLRFPAQGILRDFQGQYYSLILILYKFCAVSISLLCGDRTVSVSSDYVYTVLFGTVCFFVFGVTPPLQWARASSFTRFLDYTRRRVTFGRIPLDE